MKSWTLYSVISEGRVGRGLEVASVVAGVLGVQGVLAGLIGLARGLQITAVNISALEAALVLLTHNFSVETSGVDSGPAPPVAGWSAPPFLTADGHLVETSVWNRKGRNLWESLALPPRCADFTVVPFGGTYRGEAAP
ncbi:MAG: hypothetical protein M3256_11670 [Actinomycetota bacterium]|nr:hypothetical protein [Actinomycetota bacterium]